MLVVSAVDDATNDPTWQAVTPAATETLKIVQSQFDSLASSSEILTGILNDLARIHPFVGGTFRLYTLVCRQAIGS